MLKLLASDLELLNTSGACC